MQGADGIDIPLKKGLAGVARSGLCGITEGMLNEQQPERLTE